MVWDIELGFGSFLLVVISELGCSCLNILNINGVVVFLL